MTRARKPAAFVVHSAVHLRAALTAGAATGRPITALSAVGASAYAGPAWFAAMVAAVQPEYPDVALTAALDCDDRAGDVLTAIGLGITHIIFNGHKDAARRLRAIAGQTGTVILNRRPEALDLLDIRDAERAARDWCEKG